MNYLDRLCENCKRDYGRHFGEKCPYPFDTKFKEKQDMKLETTKERILEAARKCPAAKETLQILFPEYFEKEDKSVDCLDSNGDFAWFNNSSGERLITTGSGIAPEELKNKCFWLDSDFEWRIIKHENETLLIPTRK